jgi:DNA invertase Pin-like site-specific DNA recombinase
MASNTINRVVIYARVSTTNHGQDVNMQLRELREYASRRGWQVAKEYTDYVSGAKERRPALDGLMHDAKRRKFDVVLCWKLDRIGRSLKHLVNLLAELEAFGVALVSLSDSLDLTTPQGRLMFQIIAAMAEFERALIAERVKAGMRNARAKGQRIGRPPQTPLSPELRKVIAETYALGKTSLRALAKKFGTSLASVQRSVGEYQKAARLKALPKNI